MNNKRSHLWRKGLILSATFLLLGITTISCKKKKGPIGGSQISQEDQLLSGSIDTFSLTTFTIIEDSTITRSTSGNPTNCLLGNYNDPVFGQVSSEIYTQFHLAQVNPTFGSAVSIDSVVLSFEYSNFYGDAGVQSFEVYEITEALDADSNYFAFSTNATSATDLVEIGMGNINLDEDEDAILNGGLDTVAPQLRIPLDTNWIKTFVDELNNNSATFATNESFVEFFKGLYIKSTSTHPANDGGIGYFNMSDPDSKLTLYYFDGTDHKEFEFKINSDCVRYNHFDVDSTGTPSADVIQDTISGQTEFYAQSFNSRAVVLIPGLDNIPANSVVHEAVLELPVQYQSGHKYRPGDLIRVTSRLEVGSEDLYDLGVIGDYDATSHSYSFNLRTYVQSVLTGDIPNTGLVFSPFFFVSSADRIIFNGPETINKDKPVFRIVYTEF